MITNKKIGIAAAKWNPSVTDKLLDGALNILTKYGIAADQIEVVRCPGAFEVPPAIQMLLPHVDGAIAIGAVIRGETPHFEYINQAVSNAIMNLNIKHNKPVTFGVLTTNTMQQAAERADSNSSYGNKGAEAALTLIKMLELQEQLNKEN